MKKWLKVLLSLNSLRKALGFQFFFTAASTNHHVEILDKINPPAGGFNVLVLAPHPDDDCFGCGGLMHKISAQGKVTVAYFCDGAGGVKDSRQGYDQSLVEIRKKEAKLAGKILGVNEQIFFGYRDGKLSSARAAVKALSDLIARIKPDIIFIPSFLDNHPDHRAANDILIKAWALLEEKKIYTRPSGLEIWAYEIWSPIMANRIVMINSEIEAKIMAMETQVSQLEARNYDKGILGLNSYRAEINARDGFAEGYFATTMEIYRKLYEITTNRQTGD